MMNHTGSRDLDEAGIIVRPIFKAGIDRGFGLCLSMTGNKGLHACRRQAHSMKLVSVNPLFPVST